MSLKTKIIIWKYKLILKWKSINLFSMLSFGETSAIFWKSLWKHLKSLLFFLANQNTTRALVTRYVSMAQRHVA